jgi:hypothetical protein
MYDNHYEKKKEQLNHVFNTKLMTPTPARPSPTEVFPSLLNYCHR